jgi:uncharacterized protein (DUF3084 family)
MINKKQYERLLKQLDDIQKQIEQIHQELLINSDTLTDKEKLEIEQIRKENDYRTFDEWEKPLD